MVDLADTLAAIDAATGCQQCQGPLGGSPDRDFCCEDCWRDWQAARTAPLVGYREPEDLAAHVFNQREQYSPESIPAPIVQACDGDMLLVGMSECGWDWVDQGALSLALYGNAHYRVTEHEDGTRHIEHIELHSTSLVRDTVDLTPDTSQFEAVLEAAGFQLVAWQRQVLAQVYGTRHGPDIARAIEEAAAESSVAQRALELRRNRNTGPQSRQRAPRRIDSRGTR